MSLGQAGANSDPRAPASAIVVQVYGCSAMAAEVTATAEGVVNGRAAPFASRSSPSIGALAL